MVISLDGLGQTKAIGVSRRRRQALSESVAGQVVDGDRPVPPGRTVNLRSGRKIRCWASLSQHSHVLVDQGRESNQDESSSKERVTLLDRGSKHGRPAQREEPYRLPLVGVLSKLRKEATRTNQLFTGRFFGGFMRGFMRGELSESSSDVLAFFAGAAPYGSHLEVVLADIAGSEIGRSGTYADAAGHWSLPLRTQVLTPQPYLLELRLSPPTWEAGAPIRAYFVTLTLEFVTIALEYAKKLGRCLRHGASLGRSRNIDGFLKHE